MQMSFESNFKEKEALHAKNWKWAAAEYNHPFATNGKSRHYSKWGGIFFNRLDNADKSSSAGKMTVLQAQKWIISLVCQLAKTESSLEPAVWKCDKLLISN